MPWVCPRDEEFAEWFPELADAATARVEVKRLWAYIPLAGENEDAEAFNIKMTLVRFLYWLRGHAGEAMHFVSLPFFSGFSHKTQECPSAMVDCRLNGLRNQSLFFA